jgi:hypothetical protein
VRRLGILFGLVVLASCGGMTESAPAPLVPMYRPSANATVPFRIAFENQMSSMFEFRRLDIRLDGQRLLTDAQHALIVEHVRKGERAQFDVRLEPGKHIIRSLIEFRGSGSGNSAYLTGYKFEITSGRSFVVAPGGVITMITFEEDAPLEQRPALRYTEVGIPASAIEY